MDYVHMHGYFTIKASTSVLLIYTEGPGTSPLWILRDDYMTHQLQIRYLSRDSRASGGKVERGKGFCGV